MSENKSSEYHIGNAIYTEFVKSGLSSGQLAEGLNCTKNEVYNMFKSSTIDVNQLVKVSKALNHNFLFDIAIIVEGKTNSLDNMKTIDTLSESMVTIPDERFKETNINDYLLILDEYLSTNHQQPLLIITDKSDVADDLLYKKATELYGNRDYKMMTNPHHIEATPYMVPVFSKIEESLCYKDIDIQIGEVVAVKRTSDKHVVFILNIQNCKDTLYDEANLVYDLWHNMAHVVFFVNKDSDVL